MAGPRADNAGDIAGLSLAGPAPVGAKATRLVTADDLWSHRFRTFGFPAHHDQGVWVSGRLRGRQAAGWCRWEIHGHRLPSGTWLQWNTGVGRRARRRGRHGGGCRGQTGGARGYLIPADALIRAWPDIADQAGPPCPYRGLFAFRERDAALFFGPRGDQ